jgi:nitrate/nitrite transporter NarK
MILVCLQQFCRAAGYVFYLTWFPTFLQKAREVRFEDAGYLASWPLLGVVAGSAVGGYLLDLIFRWTGSKQHSRQGVAVVSMFACGALIVAAHASTDAGWTVALLTASSFCAGLGGPAAYTATIDLGGEHVATVFSSMNMMGNVGAYVLPLVVVPFRKAYGWNEVLLLLAVLYAAAGACWLLVRLEPRKRQEPTIV